MLPRFKSLLILAFVVLALYAVFSQNTPFSSGQHAVDVLKGFGDFDVPWGKDTDLSQDPTQSEDTKLPETGDGKIDISLPKPSPTESAKPVYFTFLPEETSADEEHADGTDLDHNPSIAEQLTKPLSVPGTNNDYSSATLQIQFDKEYQKLAL
jgi:hypothetical protein